MTNTTATPRTHDRLAAASARYTQHRYSTREVLGLTALGLGATAISLTIAFLDPAAALAVPTDVLGSVR